MGFERDVYPDILEREVSPGDIFLMCSDGLTGMITDQEMCQIFNENPPEKTTPLFIQQALAHGGDDNVTVLVLNFSET